MHEINGWLWIKKKVNSLTEHKYEEKNRIIIYWSEKYRYNLHKNLMSKWPVANEWFWDHQLATANKQK